MAIVARNKKSDCYLESPHKWEPGTGHTDELWMWTSNIDRAHHFKDRGEAKDTLRRIMPNVRMKDYTFHQAPSGWDPVPVGDHRDWGPMPVGNPDDWQ